MTSRHFIIAKERNIEADRIDYFSHSQTHPKADTPTLEVRTSVVNLSGTYVIYLGTSLKEDFKPTNIRSEACTIAYQTIVYSTRRMMYEGDTIENTIEDTLNELEQKELF